MGIQQERANSRSEVERTSLTAGVLLPDIVAAWQAHQEQAHSPENAVRRFDPEVPYAVHPLWCAVTFITEPALPHDLRVRGSQALLYHDLLEDTSAKLPAWLSDQVRDLVRQMTFYGGSQEERIKIWGCSEEVRLLKLYDKVSNFLDGAWRTPAALESARQFLRELNQDVKKHFPGLNISRLADVLTEVDRVKWPELEPEAPVRLSVANLVGRINVAGRHFYIGLLNRKNFEKGKQVYSAIGGAAEMTEVGQSLLGQLFAAEFKEGRDARLTIKADQLETVVALFEKWPSPLCESNPSREIEEELCGKELPGLGPVFARSDLEKISLNHIRTVRQAVSAGSTSARESADLASRRVFSLFEMGVPEDLFLKLRWHPAIRVFTAEELRTLAPDRKLADGASLADNIMVI